MLKTAEHLPKIDLEDADGKPFDLTDYLSGGKHVLMYFMRSASCPVCNRHVKDLVADGGRFAKAGVQVIIVVPEGRDRAARWRASSRVPYPVVTGRQGTAHAAVGLMTRVFGALQQSGTLLVDKHGIIRQAHAATVPIGSYDKAGVRAAIEALD